MMADDEHQEELLELQRQFQEDAIKIYEAKLKRKRQEILQKEEEIRLVREKIEHIKEGSKIRSRGKAADEALEEHAPIVEDLAYDEQDAADFDQRLHAAKKSYENTLLYYMEHFEVLDQVIGSKDRRSQEAKKRQLLQDLNKKLLALGGEATAPESDGSLIPQKPAATSSATEIVRREDFELLTVLGQGAFGKVWRVRHKESGKIYAMKIMKKTAVVKRDFVDHTNKEREIMAEMTHHPFYVGLHYAFQTDERVYLIMDFVGGGSLFYYLSTAPRPFSEVVSRFYASEVLLALEALHHSNIIYRDLKLENLLIDEEGHVRLSDFGLSAVIKDDSERVNSFSGTATYLAPEILSDRGEGHGKSVDFWCFGVMLFIMLTQEPPFWSENARELFHSIRTEELDWRNWPFLSDNAVSVLKGLMAKKPEDRLGCTGGGWKEVREHPFFASVDWSKLLAKKVKPPIRPLIKEGEQSNEGEEVEDGEDTGNESYPVDLFAGFSFVATGMAPAVSVASPSSTSRKLLSRSNKVKLAFMIHIKGVSGLADALNGENVQVHWKLDCKKSDKCSLSKGVTKPTPISAREASWDDADLSGVLKFELTLPQDKRTNLIEDRKLTMTLKIASKKAVVLGEVTFGLSEFASHKEEQTRIFALARNGPTIVLDMSCEWLRFNGKQLFEQIENKGGAGQLLNIGGNVYFLR